MGSNPILSATRSFAYNLIDLLFCHPEKYSSGRRGAPAKGVGVLKHARVQIPPSPPENQRKTFVFALVFLLYLAYRIIFVRSYVLVTATLTATVTA